MSQQQLDNLFDYVQERCLWQFFSRTWDRKENIEGIIKQATTLLHGKQRQSATRRWSGCSTPTPRSWWTISASASPGSRAEPAEDQPTCSKV